MAILPEHDKLRFVMPEGYHGIQTASVWAKLSILLTILGLTYEKGGWRD